jgi:hypothetical protein
MYSEDAHAHDSVQRQLTEDVQFWIDYLQQRVLYIVKCM